ncbi:MAG TPA: transporter [Methylocella sp.]|nr:transporter [Methylocella sp.]
MTIWTALRTACGAICLAGSLSMGKTAKATEFGISQYIPGLTLPMTGYTPPPGVYFWDQFALYQAGGNLIPATGFMSSTRVTRNVVANVAIVAWFPDFKLFGADPGFAVTIPFGSVRATADFAVAPPIGPAQRFSRAGEIFGIGDTEYSAILGWHAGEQHWNVLLTGFAPTGNFDSTRLVQTGLNRPALDLRGAYTYLGLQTGLELTGALGLTLNAPNTATNYQSGAELHFEWAVNQHFPLGLAAGVGGFFIQQVTDDHGSGDQLGAFRGRVAAVGPLLSYALKAGAQEVDFSARWFHDFAVQNRIHGELIYASFIFRL